MNGSQRTVGIVMIGAAVVVFILASIVQGIGGSSMFSTTYAEPDNFVLDLLMNVTFWPGWLATGALLFGGIAKLVSND